MASVREEVLVRRTAVGFPSAAVDALLDAAGATCDGVREVVAVGVVPGGRRARALGLFARLRRGQEGTRPTDAALDPAGLAAALGTARIHAPVVTVPVAAATAALAARGLPTEPAALAVGAALAHLGGDGAAATLAAPPFSDQAAYRALSNAGLPRVPVPDAAAAAQASVEAGRSVAWVVGAAGLLDAPLGPRVLRRPGRPDALLVAPDGLVVYSPVDAVRTWRASGVDVLVLGRYLVSRGPGA